MPTEGEASWFMEEQGRRFVFQEHPLKPDVIGTIKSATPCKGGIELEVLDQNSHSYSLFTEDIPS